MSAPHALSLGLSLAAMTGAIAIGSISPGPSFIQVARASMAVSRKAGLACALGMGVGSMTFATAALLGLHALFATVPWLYVLFKLGGGLYLLYIAIRLWRGAAQPLAMPVPGQVYGHGRAFLSGLATQLSNPKTAVVLAGIFAALLPAQRPLSFDIALPAIAFAADVGWYAIVACALSAVAPRAFYLRSKKWIDRVAGAVLAALALRLVTIAARP